MPPESDYNLCGWRLRSEMIFPDLRPWSGDPAHPADVRVILGTVDKIHFPYPVGGVGQMDGLGRLLIEEADGSRILVDTDSAVIVQASERADWLRIRLRVLSFVVAFLGYRRNALALHAAVLAVNGHAIALCGPSGAGKSTLATLLVARGHALLSDDVAIASREPRGPVMVQPGTPHIKITENAAEALGIAVNHPLGPSGSVDRTKHLLPVGDRYRAEARPLAAILILAAQDGDTTIRRLPAFEIVANKEAMLYRPELAYGLAERDLMVRFLALLQAVPVFRFSRPRDLARLHETAAAVEDFSQGLSDCRVPSAG